MTHQCVCVCVYPDVLQVPARLLDVHAAVKGHPAAPEEPVAQIFTEAQFKEQRFQIHAFKTAQ